MMFQDREDAGRQLAANLQHLRKDRPVVLGLTRGGIPVAFEVARLLEAPLDLIVVRKIRAGGASEPAVGAIAEGGSTYLTSAAVSEGIAHRGEVPGLGDDEVAELARRVRLYRDEFAPPTLVGRTVIVVDDFVATGMTARAAARAARRRGAARVLLAVPLAAESAMADLRREFDAVIALEVPPAWPALTECYDRLGEVSDGVALGYLRRARAGWSAGLVPA